MEPVGRQMRKVVYRLSYQELQSTISMPGKWVERNCPLSAGRLQLMGKIGCSWQQKMDD